MSQPPILQPGRNCWCVRKAEKLAFLIDGAAYFKALYDSLPIAEQQILILAWDVHSRLNLVPPEERRDGAQPTALGDLLNHLVRRRSGLRVNVLSWDFSLLYAPSREWLPVYKLDWKTHRRVKFCLDDQYPLGASHHQKVVVIDDALAFTGGLDLTRGRWDTPEHRPDDPRRGAVDECDLPITPYHDIQVAMSGPAAAALGDLARERWLRGIGKNLSAPAERQGNLWPEGLPADIENVNVAITRTRPAFGEFEEVREVEQLYLDAIAAARDYIYIENQFFTAVSIVQALAKRLAEPDGPQVVLVLPLETSGWLSQQSMDVMRVASIRRLREADKGGRFAVYFPDKPDLGEHSINLHAKLMIMDDRFARVGSSNLNNRSMGLDTECDVAIEAAEHEPDVQQSIRAFRNRLLAEHLDCDPGEVDAKIAQTGSLLEGIEALRGAPRTLRALEPKLPEPDERLLRDIRLADPERPVDSETLLKHFVPEKQAKPAGLRILRWVVVLLVLVAMAAAWRFTPLSGLLDVAALEQFAQQWRGSAIAPLAVIAAFVAGGLLVVPVTAMIVVSVLIFEPVAGFSYALAGSLISALTGYAIGTRLGKNTVRQFAGTKLNEVSRALAKRGVLTMLVVRVVPVAPFTVVNLVAGASHISFRDFALGTVFGMAPGILGITVVIDQAAKAIKSPDWQTVLTMVVVAALVIGAGYLLSRRLLAMAGEGDDGSSDENEQRNSPRNT